MDDPPARHCAAHLHVLELQPFDLGHELPLLGDGDEVRLVEETCGYRRSEQRVLVLSRHEIY
jgi:hypothetical protein